MRKRIFLMGLIPLLSSCYVLSQAGPYLSHRLGGVPIESLVDSEDPSLQELANHVQDIRLFAHQELGLEESRNFKKMVPLDRSYLAAVIQAAPEFSLEPYLFSYPLLGKLPYKGFYNPDDARKEGRRLQDEGLDVYIRPVDAFSSLGYFPDPLYSFMAEYSLYELAELIIHEETHVTVFFKNDKGFNEKLATYVGRQGALAYLESRYGQDNTYLQEYQERKERNKAYRDSLFALVDELESLYNGDISKKDMAEKKKVLIDAFRKEWDIQGEINNGYLSMFRVYEDPDNRIQDISRNFSSLRDLILFFKEKQKADKGANPWALTLE